MVRRSPDTEANSNDRLPEPDRGERPLDELRELIVGPDRDRFSSLTERLRDREVRAKEVSEVLAEAVTLRETSNQDLSRALAPTVEGVIHDSVRRNPAALVDALFPLMGPAIRKAISDALKRMVESLNTGLEHSLSPQGLRWRLEAWRTGRPFGEVVLTHTFRFRVEQVFLIEKSSGLLIEHVAQEASEAEDPSLVSGMLTAIRDFVQDSFKLDEAEGVEELQVGSLAVWVEAGPTAVLAAVIRGNAPSEVRGVLQATIEEIYRKHGKDLEHLDGEFGSLPSVKLLLERCMLQQSSLQQRKPVLGWILLAIVLLALMTFLGFVIWRGISETRQISRLAERLNQEAGLMVTEVKREGGHYRVRGFRDPLAVEPASVVEQLGIDPDELVGDWELYHSLDPAIVMSRVRQWIAPPETVDLHLEDGVLFLAGTADGQWIQGISDLQPAVFGLREFDISGLQDSAQVHFEELKLELEKRRIRFGLGSSQLEADIGESLRRDAGLIKALLEQAALLRVKVRLVLRGHTDESGPESLNRRLSRLRAETVKDALLRLGIAPDMISVVGMGTDSSGLVLTHEERRSVTYAIVLSE